VLLLKTKHRKTEGNKTKEKAGMDEEKREEGVEDKGKTGRKRTSLVFILLTVTFYSQLNPYLPMQPSK
jgi:hypothetical protein